MIDTIRSRPSTTLVPRDTGGERARALLAQLAKRLPAASLQLRHGDVIGEGGMGIVRSTEQVALGRIVAIKTLKPNRAIRPPRSICCARRG